MIVKEFIMLQVKTFLYFMVIMLAGLHFYPLNKTSSVCHSSLLIPISVLFCLIILLSFKDICFKISG